MTPAVEQLVRETMDLIGAEQPEILRDDSPILKADALDDGGDFYIVGLIGGKEVGKSALVNALSGQRLTAVTGHGPGTEMAIAYAHASQELALRGLLESEVPGEYRIVTHQIADLHSQVLFDLPDIDSRFESHLRITRSILRHMLFPVWVGSIEKYADRQPQQMLASVAAGNSPGNFLFCLNKVDQVVGAKTGDTQPLDELREDYAARIARTLKLPASPQIFMVSAQQPEQFDLPSLRTRLARQKTQEIVQASRQQAAQRQDQSLLGWLERQDLSARADRLGRLAEEAEELVAARIGAPVLEEIVPRLEDDPATRATMAEELLQERVARWPLVNLVHTLLAPLFVLVRGMVSRHPGSPQSAAVLVEASIRDTGLSVTALVQAAFAQLRQTSPALADLYAHNRLWEDRGADLAADELRRTLAATLQRQRDRVRALVAGPGAAVGAPLRLLLTIGALLWFPIIQPILEAALGGADIADWRRLAGSLVTVLGADYLLKSAAFLLIYYTVLWLALRWNTQRRVARLLARWRSADVADPSVNLADQAVEWMNGLLDPIRGSRDRAQSLAERAAKLKKEAPRDPAPLV